MTSILKQWLARIFLTVAYGPVLFIARLLGAPGKLDDSRRSGYILVNGTFHNPNWFFAHLTPLAHSSESEVILVADGHTGDIDGLTVIVPSAWAMKLFTRAGAKFLWSIAIAFKYRPDLYMGYAIFPAATTSLLLGRLFRRPACFQVTSGPLELEGGGYKAENRILSMLGKPSRWIERLVFGLTKEFDLLIVRGGQARQHIRDFGGRNRIETITGSVEMPDSCPATEDRSNDMIFVGRITERKRPDRFVDVCAMVRDEFGAFDARMVGDGPDMDAVQAQIDAHALTDSIKLLGLRNDVLALNLDSKLFVLTSRWEGVSIAMLEAMSCGAIPVVSNVGDLRDVVNHGENGYIFEEDDLDGFAAAINGLLADPAKMQRMSTAARQTVVDRCSREAITARWRETFRDIGVIPES